METYLQNPACWLLFGGALVATLTITPIIIHLAWKLGAVDHGGYRKIHDRQIPLMGGLAIIIPLLSVCLLGILQPSLIFSPLGGQHKDLALLATGGVMIAALGLFDDAHGMSAKEKFIVQIVVAILVCLAGKTVVSINLPIVGTIKLGLFGGMLLTIFWVVGLINAFNLVDGVDGLATGLALVSAIGLGIVAAINGQKMVVMVCLGLAGSLSGFLVFNFHPAKIFLGDTGSLFLGYVLAVLSLMGASKTSGSVMLLSPMLALGFPIFDTCTSMTRRILRGRSPFVGDRSHTHHRLLDYGYTQPQVALILYTVAIMCAVAAMLSQVLHPGDRGPLLAIGLYATVVMVIAWINGYLRLHHAIRIARCRVRNGKLDSFSRFAKTSLKSDASMANLQEIMRIGCKELKLRFLEIGFESEPDGESLVSINMEVEKVRSELLDPVEMLRVLDAKGRPIKINYQLNHRRDRFKCWDEYAKEVDKLEHQDVMACVANLFAGVHLSLVSDKKLDPAAQAQCKMAVVHDICMIKSKN